MDLGIALEGSTGQRVKRHFFGADDTRLRPHHCTRHGVFCLPSKRRTAFKSLIPSTGIITSILNVIRAISKRHSNAVRKLPPPHVRYGVFHVMISQAGHCCNPLETPMVITVSHIQWLHQSNCLCYIVMLPYM